MIAVGNHPQQRTGRIQLAPLETGSHVRHLQPEVIQHQFTSRLKGDQRATAIDKLPQLANAQFTEASGVFRRHLRWTVAGLKGTGFLVGQDNHLK